MDMNKPQFLSRAVLGKVLLIMAGDVVATMLSFFLGLWFRYDFSFQEIRAEHLQGFLSCHRPLVRHHHCGFFVLPAVQQHLGLRQYLRGVPDCGSLPGAGGYRHSGIPV